MGVLRESHKHRGKSGGAIGHVSQKCWSYRNRYKSAMESSRIVGRGMRSFGAIGPQDLCWRMIIWEDYRNAGTE